MGWTVYNSDGQILQGSSTLADNAVTFAKLATSAITGAPDLGEAPATGDSLLVSDLSASAALKEITVANLFAAPAITGNATAVTQSASNNSTRIATTAYVDAQVATEDTIAEMGDVTLSSIGSGEVLKWNGSAWVNNTLAEANLLPVAGPTFTGVLTVGSAVISEADLEQIDDLTAGTAVASKALVVNSNKDIGTLRNLTIDGVFTDGNYTFDTSGNVSGLGTIGSGNITSTGTVQGTTITATTAFVPDASDGAALGTASLEFSDLFLADAAVISLGDDDDVTLTHVVDTGILLSSTDRFQFGDAGTFIHQSADGVLTIESDTTVDINGAVVFDGALTGITTIAAGTTTIGSLVVAAASITDSTGTISFGNENLTTTGVVTAGGITLGSAVLIEAELELLDGLTAGTAIASKVVTTDSNIDTTGQRNLTIAGELDAATGDFSGAVDVAGAFSLAGTAITSTAAELNLLDGVSGLVQADLTKLAAVDATAAEINLIDGGTSRGTTAVASGDGILINDAGTMLMTNVDTVSTYFASHSVGGGNIVTTGALAAGSIAAGFGAIDNGTSNIRSATITAETAFVPDASGGADLGTTALEFNDAFFNDAAVINFGDDQDVTLTHVADTGLLLNSTRKIQFNDASQFIQGSSATVLSLGATDEIDLTATLIDINGNADISGTTTFNTVAYTWPSSQGSASTNLQNNGSGVLTWVAPSAGVSLGLVIALGG